MQQSVHRTGQLRQRHAVEQHGHAGGHRRQMQRGMRSGAKTFDGRPGGEVVDQQAPGRAERKGDGNGEEQPAQATKQAQRTARREQARRQQAARHPDPVTGRCGTLPGQQPHQPDGEQRGTVQRQEFRRRNAQRHRRPLHGHRR
jgi:hypothetical protein